MVVEAATVKVTGTRRDGSTAVKEVHETRAAEYVEHFKACGYDNVTRSDETK